MKNSLWKYVIVGLGTAGIYSVSLWVGSWLLGIGLYSVITAYFLAIIFNYLMNYRWTFVADVDHRLAVSKYLVMVLIGGGVNMAIVWLGLGLEYDFLLVQLVAISFVCIFNYLMSRKWVYISS